MKEVYEWNWDKCVLIVNAVSLSECQYSGNGVSRDVGNLAEPHKSACYVFLFVIDSGCYCVCVWFNPQQLVYCVGYAIV